MIIKHLLPNAMAWRVTVETQLRRFLSGLDIIETDSVEFFDGVFSDIFPDTTREIEAWETEFGILDYGASDADRRDRLSGIWKASGGQDPGYIGDTLRAAGFNVFIHDWWDPDTRPEPGVAAAATPWNPIILLKQSYLGTGAMVDCGEALAACGEAFAECGNGIDPPGYPLVNKVSDVVTEAYVIPNDVEKWPYFLYIGGKVFGTMANVDPRRRDEFEALCLKICPTHLWLGMFVEYVSEV